MTLGFPNEIEPDDPRLLDHATTYDSSRGGWVIPDPTPDASKETPK